MVFVGSMWIWFANGPEDLSPNISFIVTDFLMFPIFSQYVPCRFTVFSVWSRSRLGWLKDLERLVALGRQEAEELQHSAGASNRSKTVSCFQVGLVLKIWSLCPIRLEGLGVVVANFEVFDVCKSGSGPVAITLCFRWWIPLRVVGPNLIQFETLWVLGHLKPWALPGSKYAPLVPQIPINFTIWTYLDIAFNILVNLPGVRKGPCHEAWRCLIFDPLMLTMAKHWHGMWKRCYEPLQDWSFPLQDVGYKHLLSWSGRFICRCLATCSCLGHTTGRMFEPPTTKKRAKRPQCLNQPHWQDAWNCLQTVCALDAWPQQR